MCALEGLEGDREKEWKEPHPPLDGSQIMPVCTWKTINVSVCRVLACHSGTSTKGYSSTALHHSVSKVTALACKGKLWGHVCGKKKNPWSIWHRFSIAMLWGSWGIFSGDTAARSGSQLLCYSILSCCTSLALGWMYEFVFWWCEAI